MADRVAIVLEYLRRHHFAKAEAALQAELLARQGMDGSLFSASRNDLDLNFSLLADSGMEEGSTCHEKFLQEPWGGNFSASCNSVQQGSDPSSGEQVVEVKVLETASAIGFKKVKIQQFLPEERIPWGLQSDEREPQQGKFEYEEMLDTGDGSLSIQSGVAGCNGMENVCWQPGHNFETDTDSKLERSKGKFLRKIEDSERVFLSGSVECQRMKSGKQGELQGGTKSWKAHYENKDGTSGKGLIAQNEKEEICESWQTSMWFHDIKSQHGRVEAQLKKTSSLKEPYQVVEFLNEADAEQDANQGFCKVYAKEAREADKSEELCVLSLCEAGYDSAQPDIGAPQLEKATIVHESGEYSEKELYKLEERAPTVVGSSLLTQLESDAADSYGVLMENGWLDQEPLKNGLPRQFDSGALFKTGYPYFLCSSDQQSAIRIQRQEEKQVDLGRDSQNVKLQGKEVEMQHTDRLNDSTLPWEVNFSSKRDGLSCFEDSKSTSEKADGEFPRLPHVKLRSMDRNLNPFRETDGNVNFESALDLHLGSTNTTLEPSFELGLYLDIPLGQDINSSGSNRLTGSSRPSVSQGIVEDSPALLSGFAMLGDGPGDSGIGYPHEYWDSDGYEDDDDLGYHRQPIEDEAWFLAHEIDYPSDDERAKLSMAGTGSQPGKKHEKLEDEDHSFMEEESYFSGEQFYRPDQNESRAALSDTEGMNRTEFCGGTGESNLVSLNQIESLKYDSQLMDAEELKLMRAEPAWQGFVSQSNKLDLLSREKVVKDVSRCHEKDYFPVDDDRQGSVRSGGAGVSSDMADFGSEVRESFPEGSSEGDVESEQDPRGYGAAHINLGQGHTTSNVRTVVQDAVRHCGQGVNEHDKTVRYRIEDWGHKSYSSGRQLAQSSSYGLTQSVDGQSHNHLESVDGGGFGFGGFSFPSPSSTGDMAGSKAESGKSLWSRRENTTAGDNIDAIGNSITGPDDTLASWKRKSNESSPIRSPRDATFLNLPSSTHSTVSPHSTDGSLSRGAREVRDEAIESCDRENGEATAVDDEETAAIQEQFRQIKAGEDEYEVFNLRIIHRRNRTGFEEEKNFPVVINSVIAGRYHVTEYLGSAAFSKAIQAHDLQTGLDVCMKIIKNNKDFFDQSLDEIKLLKYINRHDPYDKFHILRLYDYFYFREHLFIVCELLRANLYEFHKFNRESGGEVYFTMPRLQSITRQCLEALEFLHNLGLIHCDLKPENILVKSYSRCEVKVIDLGSSCFQTDHLCPYVQSRSYRAPEVILGHPYNQKIDIWSLGCILAELCSGNVLFQNDSLATLLARVIGIIAPIDPEMLAKGHDTHKFFTKNYMLYERNQDTNQLEYLVPKKTSLRHRLPMGDQGFVDFVGYLLQINPDNRPSATEALKHPWLSYPYEPISS